MGQGCLSKRGEAIKSRKEEADMLKIVDVEKT